MNILLQALLAFSLTLLTSVAYADFIVGDISFDGSQTVTESGGVGTIEFGQVNAYDENRNGDFSLILGDIGGFLFPGDIEYDVATGDITNTDIDPLWVVSDSITTASFKLTSGTVTDLGVGGFAFIAGEGILSMTGFDDTAGTFGWSTQGDQLTFSAQTSAVPLPAAAWLFGSAVLGLTVVARRKREKQSIAV